MKKPKSPDFYTYKLKDGYIWNPFRKMPRNGLCPCGSLMKFKKCHLPKLPRTLDPDRLIPAVENAQKKLDPHTE